MALWLERWERRVPSWQEAAIIGLASRAFAIGVLLIAFKLQWPRHHTYWPSPFEMWDSFWFLEIAGNGYHAQAIVQTTYGNGYHDFAFFPAWPVLIRVFSLNGLLSLPGAGFVAANSLFVAATVPIFRVMERLRGRSYARVGLLLFAFSPAAYVFSAEYSEPLFLLAAGLFFVTSTPVRSASAAAVGMLTRLGGVALAAASVADLLKPETRRRGLVSIVAVVVTFGAWWVYVAGLTGDPFGYMQGSPSWYTTHLVPLPTGIPSILGTFQPWPSITALYVLVLTVGVVKLIRDGELRLGFYSAACLASTMLVTWSTMARLASVAFPAFGAVGGLLPNRWARVGMIALFAAGEGAFGLLAVQRLLTP